MATIATASTATASSTADRADPGQTTPKRPRRNQQSATGSKSTRCSTPRCLPTTTCPEETHTICLNNDAACFFSIRLHLRALLTTRLLVLTPSTLQATGHHQTTEPTRNAAESTLNTDSMGCLGIDRDNTKPAIEAINSIHTSTPATFCRPVLSTQCQCRQLAEKRAAAHRAC